MLIRNRNRFQLVDINNVFALGADGNLWLEQAPFGVNPPNRRQVDASTAAFQAISASQVLVLGTDGNLWLEQGPFSNVPPSRQQVDGNVKAFQGLPSGSEFYILDRSGNLSLLVHSPTGSVPAQRQPVDANVADFDAVSDTQVLVLGTNGVLWLENAPFGKVPPARQQIDTMVSSFQALSETAVVVKNTNGNLSVQYPLTGLGHYLPALYFANNQGAPQVETVSMNLASVMKNVTLRSA